MAEEQRNLSVDFQEFLLSISNELISVGQFIATYLDKHSECNIYHYPPFENNDSTLTGNKLANKDINKIKFYLHSDDYKAHVSWAELNGACDGIDICKILEKAELLSVNKLDNLVKILQVIGQHSLVTKVNNFKTRLQILDTLPNNVTNDMVVKHFKATTHLHELQEALKVVDVVILTGLLGSGKSQIALRYGCEFKSKNLQSIVWRINARQKRSIHSSLKGLAEKLKISFLKFSETEEADKVIVGISRIVINNLASMGDSVKHFIIIDDVNDDCKEIIEKIVDVFCRSERQLIKIVVTTNNELFLKHFHHIQVKGFTLHEALEFLNSEEKSKMHYLRLARNMSFLPLGLYAAKTYMDTVKISAKQFNKIFEKNIEKIELQMAKMDIQKDNSLFRALKVYIEILQKDVEKDVFDLFQCLQFLETDQIPVMLFNFIIPNEPDVDPVLNTNSLVQAIQKFSFGTIQGLDDQRTITVHSAVILTLSQMVTSKETKEDLLKQVLWAFVLLMGKDVRSPLDLERNKLLLPHATALLEKAEKLIPQNCEDLLLKIYLNDLVGYTYNFEGLLKIGATYYDRARKYCFEFVSCKEDVINEMARQKMEVHDHENNEQFVGDAETELKLLPENLVDSNGSLTGCESDSLTTINANVCDCLNSMSCVCVREPIVLGCSNADDSVNYSLECHRHNTDINHGCSENFDNGCISNNKDKPVLKEAMGHAHNTTENTTVKKVCDARCSPYSIRANTAYKKDFSRYKAEIFVDKLDRFCRINHEVLKVIVPKFILNKHRVKSDVRIIEACLAGSLERDCCLTENEYELLCSKNEAVPHDIMLNTLVLEIIVSVFYTSGRRIFSEDKNNSSSICMYFEDALFAKELGIILRQKSSEYPPIGCMLAERNGTLEIACDNPELWSQVTLEEKRFVLFDAAERLKFLTDENGRYFGKGILKMETEKDSFHRSMCLNLLLCCFREILSSELTDHQMSKEFSENGLRYVKNLETIMPKTGWSSRVFKLNIARFLTSTAELLENHLEKAEHLFAGACPSDILSETTCEAKVEYLKEEFYAVIGLADCYSKAGHRNKAAAILRKFKSRLESTGQTRKCEDVCSKLDEVLLKGEQVQEDCHFKF